MGKPLAGEVVVLPFPQTDLQLGKRRPAFVAKSLPGDDLVLCQITSQAHSDKFSINLDAGDFETGQLRVASHIRPNRLFTVDQKVILNSVGRVNPSKLRQVRKKIRTIFLDPDSADKGDS
jgi:mRNA interferase MazF